MDNLETLREKQMELYAKIADASGNELDSLLDEVWKVEEQIQEIEKSSCASYD